MKAHVHTIEDNLTTTPQFENQGIHIALLQTPKAKEALGRQLQKHYKQQFKLFDIVPQAKDVRLKDHFLALKQSMQLPLADAIHLVVIDDAERLFELEEEEVCCGGLGVGKDKWLGSIAKLLKPFQHKRIILTITPTPSSPSGYYEDLVEELIQKILLSK